jgi:hypothetical protein
MGGFDIIGDVHGCADKLTGLLESLEYRKDRGAYTHPERKAIYVGDLIDRGPQQVETVEIVRAMVKEDSARVIMGNHEFNAISYVTPNPKVRGDYMRTRIGFGGKNHRQHAQFLQQVGEGSARHREYIEWFKKLPLWLDLNGIRIAHACWHQPSIDVLASRSIGSAPMTEDFVVEANTKGTPTHQAVETVLKGPEVELGRERAFILHKEDRARTAARIRWWDSTAVTLRSIAQIPRGTTTPSGEPYPALPDEPSDAANEYRYKDISPVFFGHYWRTGTPVATGPAVCVDFSAVRGGPLVAYRWDDEAVPVTEHFVKYNGDSPIA